jgi:hypothetical protein
LLCYKSFKKIINERREEELLKKEKLLNNYESIEDVEIDVKKPLLEKKEGKVTITRHWKIFSLPCLFNVDKDKFDMYVNNTNDFEDCYFC